MLTMEDIKKFPVASRKSLVDYIEGMPSTLNRIVKMNLMDREMDPSFFNTRTRQVHTYCTVKNFLDKNNIRSITNPDLTEYQKEYCQLMCVLGDSDSMLDSNTRSKLINILNAECYDIETLIKVEVYIGEFLKECESDRKLLQNPQTLPHIGYLITKRIMPYKYTSYDLYGYLNSNEDLQLSKEDYTLMSKIHIYIRNLAKPNPSVTVLHDLATLIYTYFKNLGMEMHIDKYNLLARFRYAFMDVQFTEEDINTIESEVREFAAMKMNVISATDSLINTSKLGDMSDVKRHDIPLMTGSPNLGESNGTVFSFKNIGDYDSDMLGDMAVRLAGLNKSEILQYTDIAPENLSFDISDNDIGHIKNENHIAIGTAYNSVTKEMRYIIEKDGEFYLLFKDRMNTRIVYGISLTKLESTPSMDRPRKLITIKESTNFGYKYIPEI